MHLLAIRKASRSSTTSLRIRSRSLSSDSPSTFFTPNSNLPSSSDSTSPASTSAPRPSTSQPPSDPLSAIVASQINAISKSSLHEPRSINKVHKFLPQPPKKRKWKINKLPENLIPKFSSTSSLEHQTRGASGSTEIASVKKKIKAPKENIDLIEEHERTLPELREEAIARLYPRQRQAYELAAFTELTLPEICAEMRPPPDPPLANSTVVKYLIEAIEHGAEFSPAHQTALFIGIGQKRLYAIAKGDLYHWSRNGYQSYCSNQTRVRSLWSNDTKRKQLLEDIRKGVVPGEGKVLAKEHFDQLLRDICRGWKTSPPRIPKAILENEAKKANSHYKHLIQGELDQLPWAATTGDWNNIYRKLGLVE